MEQSRLIFTSTNFEFKLGVYQLISFADGIVLDIQLTENSDNYKLKIKLENGEIVIAYPGQLSKWINFGIIEKTYGTYISNCIRIWIENTDFTKKIKQQENYGL